MSLKIYSLWYSFDQAGFSSELLIPLGFTQVQSYFMNKDTIGALVRDDEARLGLFLYNSGNTRVLYIPETEPVSEAK